MKGMRTTMHNNQIRLATDALADYGVWHLQSTNLFSQAMKIIPLLVTALLLSSCVSQLSKNTAPITQHINFWGAQDDRFPDQRPTSLLHTTKLIGDGGHQLIQFPLSYAIECNSTKSDCKHAIINTYAEITAQTTNDLSVKISGVLHSEMGRSLIVTNRPSSGYSQTQSMTVPNEVAVIGEFKNDQPFERVLRLGEKLELKGLAGVHVAVGFQ